MIGMREKMSLFISYNSCLLTAIIVCTTRLTLRGTACYFEFTKGIFVVARRNYSTTKQQVAEDRLHRSRVEFTFIQHDGDVICNHRDWISGSGSVDGVGEDHIGWYIHMGKAPRKKRGQVSLD